MGNSRALSSAAERSVCIGEATGSNPVGSTTTFFLFSERKEKTLTKKEKSSEKVLPEEKPKLHLHFLRSLRLHVFTVVRNRPELFQDEGLS